MSVGIIIILFLGSAFAFMLSRGRVKRIEHPACGKCGYNVTGLPTLTCPECGSDLRVVGIVTPGTGQASSPWTAVLLWTMFAPIVLFVIGVELVGAVEPRECVTTARRTIFCQDQQINAIINVVQVGHVVVWGGYQPNRAVPPTVMDITFSHGTANMTMHVDLQSQAYHYTNSANPAASGSGTTFDASAMLDCLSDAGFDRHDGIVQQRAGDIITCINEIPTANGKFTRLGQSPGQNGVTAHPSFAFTSYQSLPWLMVVNLALGVVIWLGGVWIILRRMRGRQSGSAVVSTQAAV